MASVHLWTDATGSFVAPANNLAEATKLPGPIILPLNFHCLEYSLIIIFILISLLVSKHLFILKINIITFNNKNHLFNISKTST